MEKLPNSRQEAREVGAKLFYTGKPCKSGHTALRAVASGSCLDCMKSATKSWSKRQDPKRLAQYTQRHRSKRTSEEPLTDRRFGFTVERVREVLSTRFDGSLTLLETSVSAGHPIKCACCIHGQVLLWWNNIMRGKGCPRCGVDTTRSNAEDFIEKAKNVHGDKWGYENVVYVKAVSKVEIMCKRHGVFKQTPNHHLSGKACPQCVIDPIWEKEIYEVVKELHPDTVRKAKVLGKKEIDILVPSAAFGVELHGIHWHSEKFVGKTYHYDKWKTASDMGIQLMQVFEDEWLDNKQVVLNRIKNALGHGEKYDARKTMLGVVPSAEAKLFLEETHSQGAGTARVYYGLRYEDEWVAIASFGKARSGAMTGGTSDAWEVIRYASKGRVRGGFSKLFKRFLEDYQPNEVVSYCDLRYGTGSLYKACGFTLDGVTPPDYWWVCKRSRIPRYQTQKHKLSKHPVLKDFYDPLKTEVEICHAAGWYRIYGVGHQRWLWRKPV